MMITIQEQAERFSAMLRCVPNDMKNHTQGVHIPFANLAAVMGTLIPGKTYCFFGNRQDNALDAWYINLLGRLAAGGVACAVSGGAQYMEQDFYHLLCLRAHIDRCELKRGLFPAREQKRISSIVNEMKRYPLCWLAQEEIVPPGTAVELRQLPLFNWQKYALRLKQGVENSGRAQILFVMLPTIGPVTFEQIYSAKKALVSEEFCRYMGCVFFKKSASAETPVLQIKLRAPHCLQEKDIFFSYDYKTQALTPVETAI